MGLSVAAPPRPGAAGAARPGAHAAGLGLGVVVLWVSVLVLLPLAAVVGKAFSGGWQAFADALTDPETLAALRLTFALALAAAAISAVMGTVTAWVLVRDDFPGKAMLDLLIDLPFALPTIVAGVVMLALYGAQSPVGVHLVGTRAGLLVALLFVTLPFTVRTVQPVLVTLDREVEQAAATLGAGALTTFRRIVLPQLLPAVLSGSALAGARALGEYGSLVLISSNLPFRTQIASSVIYGLLQDAQNPAQSTRQAAAIATVLLLAAAATLLLLDAVQRRVARRG